MTDLFLIAHKVRGEPAFDIAERQICPECRTFEYVEAIAVAESAPGCPECDGEGFWWIVSTSGHRAYPFWHKGLNELWVGLFDKGNDKRYTVLDVSKMLALPSDLPDHYPTKQSKPDKSSGKSLLAALGLLPKVQRRL